MVEELITHRGSECPSDLLLDRLFLGELDGPAKADVAAHRDQCAECQARWAIRTNEGQGLDGFSMRALKRSVRSAPKQSRWSRWLRPTAIAPIGGLLAAAAAALLFVPRSDIVRAKGGIALTVHRQGASGVGETLASGDTLHPGDRIRFSLRIPAGSELTNVMIVSKEATGSTSLYHPAIGQTSVVLRNAPDGALPGAIELDDYVGQEWIHAVACPRSFTTTELLFSKGAVKSAPQGCQVDTVLIEKAAP